MREQLLAFRPDLVLVPSPIEIHPDHLALASLFCTLVQQDEALFAELAVCRVAFYEVSQTLRPNAIVDISPVAEAKYAAIAEHSSQTALRDYAAFARGLNAYRAMTLPPGTRYAEAYHVTDLPTLRTTAFGELQRQCGTAARIEVTGETVPVSVVIRTKDRPALLREALDSVAATGYPCEVVVVNDGGEKAAVDEAAAAALVLHHDRPRGRAAAANAGAEAASNAFLAFLDDDDLFYPEHLATLARAASSSASHAGWYADAVSAFLRPGPSGRYETRSRLRIFATDYDPDLLLLDNYIPLPTLLVPRASFLDAGGFDPDFDLFEDWDFLIRLSRRGTLLRIPRVTCEIRHFEGGSSVILSSPEGSDRFRAAKLQVWKKHAALADPNVVANVLERQKRRGGEVWSELVETRGNVSARDQAQARLEREKGQLIAAAAETQHAVNGHLLRIRELEATIAAFEPMVSGFAARTAELALAHSELAQVRSELDLARVEIGRLNGLLNMIYGSRTWRVHNLFEKLRGRG